MCGDGRVTNPHDFEVDGVTFLGTSGQNLDDVDRYSTAEERLDMLQVAFLLHHPIASAVCPEVACALDACLRLFWNVGSAIPAS